MLAGRSVWGIVMFALMAAVGSEFSLSMFLAGAFGNAVPGIILQLILIPVCMLALHKAGLVPFRHTGTAKTKCS